MTDAVSRPREVRWQPWLGWVVLGLPPVGINLIAWGWNGLYRRIEAEVQVQVFRMPFESAPWYRRDDHYFHFIIAGWLVLWLAWLFARWGWHWRWAAGLMALACALDEAGQAFDPERSCDWVDLLSGWTGVVFAAVILGWWKRDRLMADG